MTSLIVIKSIAHGNTRRVAEAMAEVLKADVVEADEAHSLDFRRYDLVGFGSGVYYNRLHRDLRNLIDSLPHVHHGRAFLFATSGFRTQGLNYPFRGPAKVLAEKGYALQPPFACRGLDTWAIFGLLGGHAKGHPTVADLDAAADHTRRIRAETLTREGRRELSPTDPAIVIQATLE